MVKSTKAWPKDNSFVEVVIQRYAGLSGCWNTPTLAWSIMVVYLVHSVKFL